MMEESYKKALKEYYEKEKARENYHSLLNPTPAGLRNILISKMKEELDDSDKKIIESFFEIPFTEVTPNKLRSETDKFKALSNFLKEKSGGSDLRRLEMIALILDFKQRPYHKFVKINKNIQEIHTDTPATVEIAPDLEKPIENTKEVGLVATEVSVTKQRNIPLKNIGIIGIVVIVGISVFFNIKNWTTKDCMVWKGEKYEAIDCNQTINGFLETTLPKDDKLIKEFRKVKVSNKTSFFDAKGNPKVWYVKNPNGTLDFFNQPGLHPETGKTLKPISKYIIQEYVLR